MVAASAHFARGRREAAHFRGDVVVLREGIPSDQRISLSLLEDLECLLQDFDFARNVLGIWGVLVVVGVSFDVVVLGY